MGRNPIQVTAGLGSPVPTNIYLHYVLDMCFQNGDDARCFRSELTKRLTEFDLEVEPRQRCCDSAMAHNETVIGTGCAVPIPSIFLGLPTMWAAVAADNSSSGDGQKASGFKKKLQMLNKRLRQLRVEGGKAMIDYFKRHLCVIG